MKTFGGKIDIRPFPSRRSRGRAGSSKIVLIVLLLLLVLPTLAIYRLHLDPLWLGILVAYVLIYQVPAGDSFQDWKLSRAGLEWIQQPAK